MRSMHWGRDGWNWVGKRAIGSQTLSASTCIQLWQPCLIHEEYHIFYVDKDVGRKIAKRKISHCTYQRDLFERRNCFDVINAATCNTAHNSDCVLNRFLSLVLFSRTVYQRGDGLRVGGTQWVWIPATGEPADRPGHQTVRRPLRFGHLPQLQAGWLLRPEAAGFTQPHRSDLRQIAWHMIHAKYLLVCS